MEKLVGKVISVSELNVRVLVEEGKIRIQNILYAEVRGKRVCFEVAEEDGNVVSAIPLQSAVGLKKGTPVYWRIIFPCSIMTNCLERYLTPMAS